LFRVAIENLGKLDEYESPQVFEELDARLKLCQAGQPALADPLLATWPEPQMLRQVVDRLNQWVRGDRPAVNWEPPVLPEEVNRWLKKQPPPLSDLARMEFSPHDGFALMEAVWLRAASHWASGEELDELLRAQRLFDWTVRNITLEAEETASAATSRQSLPRVPWEVLFFGRGSVWERAWVFLLLARQQGLDAAVLGVIELPLPAAAENSAGTDTPLKPWAVAVLIAGEAYLFDPALGLPIPAPDYPKLDDRGRLQVRPATLAQVCADERLLRRLDINADRPYPIKDEQLCRIVALVEASPWYLTKRMKLIESRLAGAQKLVLTADPETLIAGWKDLPHIAGARCWSFPYEVLVQRMNADTKSVHARLIGLLPYYAPPTSVALRQGRILYLRGNLTGEQSAIAKLLRARPPDAEIEKFAQELIKRRLEEAKKSGLRPGDQTAQRQWQEAADQEARLQTALLQKVKLQATCWLAQASLERGEYQAAIDWAARAIEAAPSPEHAYAAWYTIGRALEAAGHATKAIAAYESLRATPAAHGALLRARWLRQSLERPR
jgi:tetratricopeptide (TPR) repeat protein